MLIVSNSTGKDYYITVVMKIDTSVLSIQQQAVVYKTDYRRNSNNSRRFLASQIWLREFIGVNMLALILEKEGGAQKRGGFVRIIGSSISNGYGHKHGEYRSVKGQFILPKTF